MAGEGATNAGGGGGAHVLLLPFAAQGHINPMLQFGKRLTTYGLRATLAATRDSIASAGLPACIGPVAVVPISYGGDESGLAQAGSTQELIARVESFGSASLAELITVQRAEGRPVRALVYDSSLPWALDVGKKFGLFCVTFFTQSCAVDQVYWLAAHGQIELPWSEPELVSPYLNRLEPRDMPSFLVEPDRSAYPAFLDLVLKQHSNVDRADYLLVNSFLELERQEAEWMESTLRARTIGPTVPAMYLDNRIPGDSQYGFSLLTPDYGTCKQWLDAKPPMSVVYVSFGSTFDLASTRMEEVARGLQSSGKHFLWVVKAIETGNLPENFMEDTSEQGLVVSWCSQLEVLAHEAVACFVTHCGWNSTTEALSLGVPIVAVPQWTDQPTNAKYIEDVWKVGVRARKDEAGVARREEVERCVREVMDGKRSQEMRKNADKWRESAKAAVTEGGSSDKNIVDFVAKCCSHGLASQG